MARTRVGNRVRERRLIEKITLDDLARDAGVARSQLCAIESGTTSNPSGAALARLALALGLNATSLLNDLLPPDEPARLAYPKPSLVLTANAIAAGGQALQDMLRQIAERSSIYTHEQLAVGVFRVMADAMGVVAHEPGSAPRGAYGADGRLVRNWDKLPSSGFPEAAGDGGDEDDKWDPDNEPCS